MNLTLLLLAVISGLLPVFPETAPPTGDPVMIIAAVVIASVVAMVVLSIFSKRGKGGRRR